VGGNNHLVRFQSCKKTMGLYTASYKMQLFHAKTTLRGLQIIEIASLKKEEKTFWQI